MRSSRTGSSESMRLAGQRGMGLVEVLVASAILGIAVAVMLGNMSTMVVGATVADRKTGEERLVRNQIEILMAQAVPSTCPPKTSTVETVDATKFPTKYTVTVGADCRIPHYLEYTVTATVAPGGPGVHLTVGRYQP